MFGGCNRVMSVLLNCRFPNIITAYNSECEKECHGRFVHFKNNYIQLDRENKYLKNNWGLQYSIGKNPC